MKRELKYFFLMIVLVAAYIVIHYSESVSGVEEMVAVITAIIAAVGFWLELKRSKDLNEATFIMDLNDQFISNQDFTRVEHALELYCDQWNDGGSSPTLALDLSRDSSDCQSLINYLVYMEGLAALIDRNVMRLNVTDDLFAYRFFIAVNNPIVQRFELLPYANYYQGCFALSEKWTKQWRNEKRPIPLERDGETHALYECSKDLINKPYKSVAADVEIRTLTMDDDLMQAALCLYLTDPYIYPSAFGSKAEEGIKAISCLMKEDGLFHYSNFVAAFYENRICGIMLCNKNGFLWDKTACADRVKRVVHDMDRFCYVAEHYFSKVSEAPEIGCIEVVALCVNPEYRQNGIGKKMLQWLINNNPGYIFTLDVLADNHSAVTMYRHCGFQVKYQHKGFVEKGGTPPDCYRMERRISSAD